MDALQRTFPRLQLAVKSPTGVLALGSIAGRIFTFAITPAITRLYQPEDFASLAVFVALTSTLSVISCLRYELAIPIAGADQEARALLGVSFSSLAITVLITLAIALAFPHHITRFLHCSDLTDYVWLVPTSIAFTATYSILQLWAARKKRFIASANARVLQAVIGGTTTITCGAIGIGPLGLVLGHVSSAAAGGMGLLLSLRCPEHRPRFNCSSGLLTAAKRHLRYPVLSVPESLMNIAGLQVPLMLIAARNTSDGGSLFLAMQVLAAPMSLIGSSIAQVYSAQAPQQHRDGLLGAYTASVMLKISLAATGPVILTSLLAPITFPWLFGEQWTYAGLLVRYMGPWMLLQLIASPVSMAIYIAGQPHVMAATTCLGLCLRLGAVLASLINPDSNGIHAFIVASSAFYLVLLLCVASVSGAWQGAASRFNELNEVTKGCFLSKRNDF